MKLIENIKSATKKFPRRSVNYLLFCLSGVLLFVFGGIAPAYWNRVQLDQEIMDARRRIEEYGTLQPVFHALQNLSVGASRTLTVPPRAALPRNDIEQVDATFREIAGRFGMKVLSTVPDFLSAGDPHELAVNVSLRGDFENFRNLLRKLGELPYVDHIEEFAIQRSGNQRALDIMIKISLAVN